MYFSKLTVAKMTSIGQYSRHQLIWKLFPSDTKRNFIYSDTKDTNVFFIVSKTKPVSTDTLRVESKGYSPELKKGRVLSFQLTANPTVTLNGKRHDIIINAKKKGLNEDSVAKTWLKDKGAINGFEVVDTEISGHMKNVMNTKGRKISYTSLTYSGCIRVKNVALFEKALFDGLGHSKAFGCGLLMVKSV